MATIKLRRGTAAEWSAANPILADGEPGYEKDTRKEKRGDGVTHWIDLPYLTTGTGSGGTSNTDVGDPTIDLVAEYEEARTT